MTPVNYNTKLCPSIELVDDGLLHSDNDNLLT